MMSGKFCPNRRGEIWLQTKTKPSERLAGTLNGRSRIKRAVNAHSSTTMGNKQEISKKNAEQKQRQRQRQRRRTEEQVRHNYAMGDATPARRRERERVATFQQVRARFKHVRRRVAQSLSLHFLVKNGSGYKKASSRRSPFQTSTDSSAARERQQQQQQREVKFRRFSQPNESYLRKRQIQIERAIYIAVQQVNCVLDNRVSRANFCASERITTFSVIFLCKKFELNFHLENAICKAQS